MHQQVKLAFLGAELDDANLGAVLGDHMTFGAVDVAQRDVSEVVIAMRIQPIAKATDDAHLVSHAYSECCGG